MSKLTRSLIGVIFLCSLFNNTVFSNEINQSKEELIKICSEAKLALFNKYSIKDLKSKSISYCSCIHDKLNEKFPLLMDDQNIKQQQFLMTKDGASLMNKCHNSSFSFFETYKRNFIDSCSKTRFAEFQKDPTLTTKKLKENIKYLENVSFSYCYCLFLDSMKHFKLKPEDINESLDFDSKLSSFFKSTNGNELILNCEKKAMTIGSLKTINN